MLDPIIVAVAAAAAPLVAGTWVTYRMVDLPRCARATYVDNGADGLPWAWIVGGNAPQWVLHVPVTDLMPGCVEKRRKK